MSARRAIVTGVLLALPIVIGLSALARLIFE